MSLGNSLFNARKKSGLSQEAAARPRPLCLGQNSKYF